MEIFLLTVIALLSLYLALEVRSGFTVVKQENVQTCTPKYHIGDKIVYRTLGGGHTYRGEIVSIQESEFTTTGYVYVIDEGYLITEQMIEKLDIE